MKFSDGLFYDEKAVDLEKKITKLSTDSFSTTHGKIAKIQRQLVDHVVGDPEFSKTVNSLSFYIDQSGTEPDKDQYATLRQKTQSGTMDYNDVRELYALGNRSYKFFFNEKPSFFPSNPAAIIGFVITLAAIIMRFYGNEDTNLVLMCAINIGAIIFTTIFWPNAVRNKLCQWADSCAMPKVIRDKLITPVTKKMWRIVLGVLIAFVAVLPLTNWLASITLGNDILSIISLSTAVLSDNIVDALVNLFQWRMYYNKER